MNLDKNRQRLHDLGPEQCLKRGDDPTYLRVTEDGEVKRASKAREGEYSERTIGTVTSSAPAETMDLQLELANNEYELASINEYPDTVD